MPELLRLLRANVLSPLVSSHTPGKKIDGSSFQTLQQHTSVYATTSVRVRKNKVASQRVDDIFKVTEAYLRKVAL